MQKPKKKCTESPEHGYSSESTQGELSHDDQHYKVLMVVKNLCVLVLWTEVYIASALAGLTLMLLVANLANTK